MVTGGATVWRGTAIQCPDLNSRLILRHTNIRTFRDIRGCKNGDIIAQGTRFEVANNSYTSQLNITVDSSMDNSSVECTYNNGTITTIGESLIAITKGMVECDLFIRYYNSFHIQLFSIQQLAIPLQVLSP